MKAKSKTTKKLLVFLTIDSSLGLNELNKILFDHAFLYIKSCVNLCYKILLIVETSTHSVRSLLKNTVDDGFSLVAFCFFYTCFVFCFVLWEIVSLFFFVFFC